jgi:uncharacterized protein YkwD
MRVLPRLLLIVLLSAIIITYPAASNATSSVLSFPIPSMPVMPTIDSHVQEQIQQTITQSTKMQEIVHTTSDGTVTVTTNTQATPTPTAPSSTPTVRIRRTTITIPTITWPTSSGTAGLGPTATPITHTPTPTTKPTATATPKITSSPTATPTSQTTNTVQEFIMQGINTYRSSLGLSKVQTSSETCAFAKTRAQEVSLSFNHDGFRNRINAGTIPYTSWSLITENLAMTSNYKDVVNMWINSPGHAENMRKDTPFVCVEQYGNYYAYEGMRP